MMMHNNRIYWHLLFCYSGEKVGINIILILKIILCHAEVKLSSVTYVAPGTGRSFISSQHSSFSSGLCRPTGHCVTLDLWSLKTGSACWNESLQFIHSGRSDSIMTIQMIHRYSWTGGM